MSITIRFALATPLLFAGLHLAACGSLFNAATGDGTDPGNFTSDDEITDTIDGGGDYMPVEEGGTVEIPVGSAKGSEEINVYLNVAAMEYDFQDISDEDVALQVSELLPIGSAFAAGGDEEDEESYGNLTLRCGGLCASANADDFDAAETINNSDLERHEVVVTNESTGVSVSTALRADGTFPDLTIDGGIGDGFDVAVRLVGDADKHSWANLILGGSGSVQISLTLSSTQKYIYEMARGAKKIFFIADDESTGVFAFKSIPQRGGEETDYFHLTAKPMHFQVSPDGKWLTYRLTDNAVSIYDVTAGKTFQAAAAGLVVRSIDVANLFLAFSETVDVPLAVGSGPQVKLTPFSPYGVPKRGRRHKIKAPESVAAAGGMQRSVVTVQPLAAGAGGTADAQHQIILADLYGEVGVQFNEPGDRLYILAKDEDGTDVYRYSLVTQAVELLTTLALGPTHMDFDLADDATALVFAADDGMLEGQIYELDLGSLALKTITHARSIIFSCPRFLPNGSTIIAQGKATGDTDPDGGPLPLAANYQEIFRLDRDGGDLQPTTAAYEQAYDPQITDISGVAMYKSVDKQGYMQINLLPLE
jgi:hypothetical protein